MRVSLSAISVLDEFCLVAEVSCPICFHCLRGNQVVFARILLDFLCPNMAI